MTEKTNPEKMLDASKDIFNVIIGGVMKECASEEEAVREKFMAELDSKIRSGELTNDGNIAELVASYPTLSAKMPNIKRDIKEAVQMDRNIRGLKKVKEYQTALKKKQDLDNKREGAEALTKEEERLVALSQKYEAMDKKELLQKGQEIAKKEAENRKKPLNERQPLTQEERDIKEFNAIKGWEAYATDTRVQKIQDTATKKGEPEADYWSELERNNEELKNWKRLYEGAYDTLQKPEEQNKNAQESNGATAPVEYSGSKEAAKWGDPDTIDWLKFREEVIWKNLDNLTKINNPADLGFAVFTTLFVDMAADAVSNLNKQMRELKKKNAKDARESRKAELDSNLKQRSLNQRDLSHLIALDAKKWITDVSEVKNIDLSNPRKLTRREKFLLDKAELVRQLPKTPDGDLDFSKFSKKQQAEYDKLVTIYFNSPVARQKITSLQGVEPNKDEMREYIKMGCDAKPRGGMDHAIESARIEKSPVQAPIRVEKIDDDINQAVDKVFSGQKTTEADRKVIAEMLAERGMKKEDIDKLNTFLKDQEQGKTSLKLSEEVKQSLAQVAISGSLDNYVIADTLSKSKLTEADQVKIALQVDRLAKKHKSLAERMQLNDRNMRALAQSRQGLSLGIEMQGRKREKEGGR